jgi:hypothetical protein
LLCFALPSLVLLGTHSCFVIVWLPSYLNSLSYLLLTFFPPASFELTTQVIHIHMLILDSFCVCVYIMCVFLWFVFLCRVDLGGMQQPIYSSSILLCCISMV